MTSDEALISELADAIRMPEMPPHVRRAVDRILKVAKEEVPVGPGGFNRREAVALFLAIAVGGLSALWADAPPDQQKLLMAACRRIADQTFVRWIEKGCHDHT